MSVEPAEGWVLFDGGCGVCSRWALFWGPKLQRLGFGIAPLQSDWVPNRTGLSSDQLLRDIQLLSPDGSVVSGAEVYRCVMRKIWWAYPLYLLSLVPGLRQIFNWSYRAFARHRLRISSACGLPHYSTLDAGDNRGRGSLQSRSPEVPEAIRGDGAA